MKSFKVLHLTLALAGASLLGGCFLTDGGKTSGAKEAQLVLSVGVKDVNNLSKPGLAKTAAGPEGGIVLSRLVITLTSSVAGDAVIRDTIVASDTAGSTFTSASDDDQQVLKNFAIKPLRNWTVEVKTLDVNDSVIHYATTTTGNVGVGDLVPVQLNLASKFVVYVAKFVLPDSIGSSDTAISLKQRLFINRFMMVVDGDTVRDTTASTYFTATPAEHLLTWNYVRADTVHELRLYVFADSLRMADSSGAGTWTWPENLPLFGDTIQITDVDSTYAPELPWTGPGSPHDPNYDPANPGGARAGLEVNIGAVGRVNINPSLPVNPLPKLKDR